MMALLLSKMAIDVYSIITGVSDFTQINRARIDLMT